MITRTSFDSAQLFWFLLTKVPTVLWAGIKVNELDTNKCHVTIERNWRNGNPNKGVYFANILTAAEMASGIMVFDEMHLAREVAGIKLAAFVTKVSSDFIRPVKGKAEVRCLDGIAISGVVLDAIANGSAAIDTSNVVYNERGKVCSRVHLSWHIKRID